MTARDELALELFIGDNANQPREASIADWEYFHAEGRFQGRVEHYKAMAEHVLAAGCRKTKQVTTAEELDALAVESVVRSDIGNVYVKDYDLDDPAAIWWVAAGAVSEYPSIAITLPATVLYEPEPQP